MLMVNHPFPPKTFPLQLKVDGKTIESYLPVGIWLKVVSFIKFDVATTAEESVVLNHQWFLETLVQATKVLCS